MQGAEIGEISLVTDTVHVYRCMYARPTRVFCAYAVSTAGASNTVLEEKALMHHVHASVCN